MKLENYAHQIIEMVAGYRKQDIKAAIESGELSSKEEIAGLIEDVRLDIEVKFILVGTKEGKILKIFDPSITHADQVYKNSGEEPIGAGNLRGGDLAWDSHSFRKEFGYDKPATPETADTLLSEIDNHISTWIEEYCKS